LPEIDNPNSSIGRSWKFSFKANTKEELERNLTELNYKWEWLDNDMVRVIGYVPAVRTASNGRRSFMN
jgi:hypothetical protein